MVICLDEGHDHINNPDSKMVLDHLIFHVIFKIGCESYVT